MNNGETRAELVVGLGGLPPAPDPHKQWSPSWAPSLFLRRKNEEEGKKEEKKERKKKLSPLSHPDLFLDSPLYATNKILHLVNF